MINRTIVIASSGNPLSIYTGPPNLVHVFRSAAEIFPEHKIENIGRLHLVFHLPVTVLMARLSPKTRNTSEYQISSESRNARLTYCDFTNFQDGRRPPYRIVTFASWTVFLVVQRRRKS